MRGAQHRGQSSATARTKTPVQRDQAAKCHPRYLAPAGRMTGHSRAKRHERQLRAADNGNEAVVGYRLPPATWTCQARCPSAVHFRSVRTLDALAACLRVQSGLEDATLVRLGLT